MLTKTKAAAAAAALILSTASLGTVSALASDSGEYSGGFVMPGSMDGVNPSYHPDLFSNRASGAKAYGYANGWNAFGYAKGSKAFGYTDEGNVRTPSGGDFVNGTFIPRGTSPAQIPSHPSEPE